MSDEESTLIGEFLQGEAQGEGKVKFKSGTTFEGLWKKDKKHGRGQAKFRNGNEFRGCFAENKIQGQGTFTDAKSKVTYRGKFADSARLDWKPRSTFTYHSDFGDRDHRSSVPTDPENPHAPYQAPLEKFGQKKGR